MNVNIKKLINKDLIFVIDKEIKKDEILNFLIDKSEDKLNIGTLNSLKEAIFKKEEDAENMTAIGNYLAIPHGIFFDYSYEVDLFITIAKITNGVDGYDSPFDNNKTKYIFLIAYNQDTYCTKRTSIMPILAKFFSDTKNIEKLDSKTTPQEIFDLLLENL